MLELDERLDPQSPREASWWWCSRCSGVGHPALWWAAENNRNVSQRKNLTAAKRYSTFWLGFSKGCSAHLCSRYKVTSDRNDQPDGGHVSEYEGSVSLAVGTGANCAEGWLKAGLSADGGLWTMLKAGGGVQA